MSRFRAVPGGARAEAAYRPGLYGQLAAVATVTVTCDAADRVCLCGRSDCGERGQQRCNEREEQRRRAAELSAEQQKEQHEEEPAASPRSVAREAKIESHSAGRPARRGLALLALTASLLSFYTLYSLFSHSAL